LSSSQLPSGERPSSAEDAYALLLRLREQGSAPDFETWVRQFPEFEPELRALEESWADIGTRLERVLGSSVRVSVEPLVPSLAPGLAVGEFTLVRRIGVGGMGVVWLARQRALDRDVALKFVRPDRETALSAELFAREARAAGRARDARIATVYAVGESAGHRWLAQEYVPDSRSLAHWLRELRDGGALPGHDRRAAEFIADVAEALHAAHELGVVHRDVKPQNVLIAPDGRPKLTDFGLARLLDESALSETLTIRGTVEYMSPEQVTGATHKIDRRSDVFSLGVVLYELLTLERPFTGLTTLEVIAAISVREPRRPGLVRPGLARELDVIALKALQKEPQERYASALELARDLRRFLAHEPIAARPPGPWRRFVQWTRRRPAQAVLAGAAAFVLLLLLAGIPYLLYVREVAVDDWKRVRIEQMHLDIDDARLEQAQQQLASFLELDDDDPEAHLVMAMGYARFLRFAEAEIELAQAERMGFDPRLGPDPGAKDLYLRGLWLIAQRDAGLHAEAAELLTRAGELDPGLDPVWFPLYQVRKSSGDIPGARQALENFIGSLQGRDDFLGVAKALLAELDGNHDEAISSLLELRSKVDETRARDLRLHRHLGRIFLLEYLSDLGARPELLSEAEAALKLAVADYDDDGSAWAALGMVYKQRADLEQDPVERERLRGIAREHALRGTERDLGLEQGTEVLAMLAFDAIAGDFHAARVPESELDVVEQHLERVRELVPDSRLIPILESGVAYYRGAFALARGDKVAATAYFEDSVRASERQLYARVKLGQRLVGDQEDHAGAQRLFAEALALWDSGQRGVPGEDPGRERKWLLAAAVWLFGAADRSGDLATARSARDRALRELDTNDDGMESAEMLTLAEYLALARHPELKDCALALTLIEDRGLEQQWMTDQEGARVLREIQAECGD
jgi:tetratricopeptide (TPR) repeat protein